MKKPTLKLSAILGMAILLPSCETPDFSQIAEGASSLGNFRIPGSGSSGGATSALTFAAASFKMIGDYQKLQLADVSASDQQRAQSKARSYVKKQKSQGKKPQDVVYVKTKSPESAGGKPTVVKVDTSTFEIEGNNAYAVNDNLPSSGDGIKINGVKGDYVQ